MAPTSHGRVGPNGRDSFANGLMNNNNGPPPSTLAAQLVENISTSARSSRPDETAELKKFFGVIEKVKNQPDLLKTQKERMEHNHMLIYVYTRVVLEGLRWDDPFADKTQLRTDALRAVNFLRITIRETPEVLLVKSETASFLFRGSEPLWLWIFPKVLKMLGSSHCADLKDEIELLFREVLITASQAAGLWPLVPQFLTYIKLNFDGMHEISPDSHREQSKLTDYKLS